MKERTQLVLAGYILDGKFDFSVDLPFVKVELTSSEMRKLINMEYGIRSKRSRIIKKYMTRLINVFCIEIVKDLIK